MSSFDLNNINSSTPQQVQAPISTKNIPMIREKIDLSEIQAKNSYIEERTIASLLREKEIYITKQRLQIAMALYYQSQEITKENIEYMEKMSEILKLNSQESFEAYLILVTNTLEVTDERVASVKEIIINKNIVNELEDLKFKIDELDVVINQAVEEHIFTQLEDVQIVVKDNISDENQTQVNLIEEQVDSNIEANNLIYKNTNEVKTETKITQKSIENNFVKTENTDQKSEIINQQSSFVENKLVNKNDNLQLKNIVTEQSQEISSLNNINAQKQLANSEKLVVEKFIPKENNNLLTEIKKINKQINTLLGLKKEIFTISNPDIQVSNNSEFLGVAKFSSSEKFFENIQTFEGGLRNFGMSDDAKSIYAEKIEAPINQSSESEANIYENTLPKSNLDFKIVNNKPFIQVKNGLTTVTYQVRTDINNLKENVPYLALINDIPKLIEKDKTNIKILQVNLNISDDILNMVSAKSIKTVIIDGKPNLFIIDKPISNILENRPNINLKNTDNKQESKLLSNFIDNNILETLVKNNIVKPFKPQYKIEYIDNKPFLTISNSESLNKQIQVSPENKSFISQAKNIDNSIQDDTNNIQLDNTDLSEQIIIKDDSINQPIKPELTLSKDNIQSENINVLDSEIIINGIKEPLNNETVSISDNKIILTSDNKIQNNINIDAKISLNSNDDINKSNIKINPKDTTINEIIINVLNNNPENKNIVNFPIKNPLLSVTSNINQNPEKILISIDDNIFEDIDINQSNELNTPIKENNKNQYKIVSKDGLTYITAKDSNGKVKEIPIISILDKLFTIETSENLNTKPLDQNNKVKDNKKNQSITELPKEKSQILNNIRKEILSYEYSNSKENFSNNVKNLFQSEKMPILLNNNPVVIDKQNGQNITIPLDKINKVQNLPDYLEAKVANKDFVFIKDLSGNNILIPNLKVSNNVIKDINNLISVKDNKGEDKIIFKDPETGTFYLLPKSREDIKGLFENNPKTIDNNIIIGSDSNNDPVIIINSPKNQIINHENINQNILTNTSFVKQILKTSDSINNENEDNFIDISEEDISENNESKFINNYIENRNTFDNKNVKINTDSIINKVLSTDNNQKVEAIKSINHNAYQVEEEIEDNSTNVENESVLKPENKPTTNINNKTIKATNNSINSYQKVNSQNILINPKIPSLGIIKINSSDKESSLKIENFDKPLFIKINTELKAPNNSKNEFLGKLIFSDNGEIYNFDTTNKFENLVSSNQNTNINRTFSKKGFLNLDNGFIFKQEDKIFNTEITPQLINNAQILTKGINISPNNNIFIYDDKGIKVINPDTLPNNNLIDSLGLENPLVVKFDGYTNNDIKPNNLIQTVLLFKSTVDDLLRIIPAENLINEGFESEFNQPVMVNLEDKKGIAFKNPSLNSNFNVSEQEIKFIPFNNLVANSEKISSPILTKIDNQNSLVIPDKNDFKVFNIDKNLNSFENVNDKLKVKIDGKSFFVVPDDKTGEHIVMPEKSVITKNTYSLSEPLRVQIGNDNFILNVNPNSKKLQIIPENKCKNLSEKLINPIQTNIKGNECILSFIDSKPYKTLINDKLLKSSKDITEPAKIIGKKLEFLVNNKNQGSIVSLNQNIVNNSQKLENSVKLNINGQENILIPNILNKNTKLINIENILRSNDLPKNNDFSENDILFKYNNQPILLNKKDIIKNSKEVTEPFFVTKNGNKHLFVSNLLGSENKKFEGLLPKENIIKNSDILENMFIPNTNTSKIQINPTNISNIINSDNQSKFIFKDQNGHIKICDIPNNLINNPDKVTENIQVKIDNKNIVIVPSVDENNNEKINYIVPNIKDIMNNNVSNKENNLSIFIDNNKYSIIFDKDKPKLVDFSQVNNDTKQDLSKPFKININDAEYIVFKSNLDNKLKILPVDKLKNNLNNEFNNLDIESINSFDISDLVIENHNSSTILITSSNDIKNISNTSDSIDNKVVINPATTKNIDNLQEPKILMSLSNGEIVLKRVSKESQSEINIDNIQNKNNNDSLIPQNINQRVLEKSSIISTLVGSQAIKENKLDNNFENIDENESISEKVQNPQNKEEKVSKSSGIDNSKYDVKISYESLLNSVLSGNNDKGSIESIKNLSLFTHNQEELLLTEDETNNPILVNLKDQPKENFATTNKYTLAQNIMGKETLIIKSSDNSFKTFSIDKQFEDINMPIQDEEGNIFVVDNNNLFKIHKKSMSNLSDKSNNIQNMPKAFVNLNNQFIVKHENNYVKTDINKINSENIDLHNNPILANINGKENIIIEHNGNLKSVPLNSITTKIEKINDSTILNSGSEKILFIKDNNDKKLVNIIDVKNQIKDPSKFNFIVIDGQKYKVDNNKIVLHDNKDSLQHSEINLSKPIKISYSLGEGIIYKDPDDKKLKFIDNKDINKNNRISNNVIQKANDNLDKSYLSVRKDSIIKFKISDIILENSNNINEIKDISFDGQNHFIIPQKDNISKLQNSFIQIVNKNQVISNSENINEPFFITNDTDKNLVMNTDRGIKVLKNSDISSLVQKIEEPVIFESNNQINVIKNESGKFSIAKIESKDVENTDTKSIPINNQKVQNPEIKQNINPAINNQESEKNEINIQNPKNIEQNVLTNTALTYQIAKSDNSFEDHDISKTQNTDFKSENKIENFNDKSINPKDTKNDLKMSGDQLINYILSPKSEDKKIEGINELLLFTGDIKDNDEPESDLITEKENKQEEKFNNKNDSTLVTYGKERKVLVNDNGQIKEVNINQLDQKQTNKPKTLLVNHQGENKIISLDKSKMVNISKLNVENLYNNLLDQKFKKENLGFKDPPKDIMTSPQMETIRNDIMRTKQIISSIVNNDILEKPQDLSKQVNQMSMMFGILESQVKTLKKDLEPFKTEYYEEEYDGGLLGELLPFSSRVPKKDTDKKTDKKLNYDMKTSFESLLKSVLSEVYSKVEKVSLNLQGREILSNNEKCFCIPVSIPIGQLRFNGEIMIKSDDDRKNKKNGKNSLSITLSVETKTLNTVVIDIMNIEKDVQISLKVDNEKTRIMFNEKISKLNEILKGSSYNIKPVTCSVNQNKGRSNSLLVQKDTFAKSLKRVEGII